MARLMKHSGVDWLGDIPAHWNVINIRKLFSFGKGLSITKEDLRESGQPVVSYGQIHSKLNSGTTLTPELIRFVDDDYLQSNPQSLVKRGDFIFADTSEDLAGCGNCVYVDADAPIFAGYHTIILRSKTCANLKYFAFLFLSDAWRKQIRERVTGVKLFSISQKILRATSVLVPPIDEQERIAAYLDDKCGRIDSVIAKTVAAVAEYKKLKQAIITRAVTRGIRPDRTLKHSGIDWLGDIPDDWLCRKLKTILVVNDSGVWGNDPVGDDSDKIVIRSTEQTIDGQWNIDKPATRDLSSIDYKKFRIKKDDLLITKSSGSDLHIGKTTIADDYFISHECYYSNFIQRIRCSGYSPKFLWYLFNSPIIRAQCVYLQNSTSGLGNINADIIRNLYIPVPPIDEQREIAAYLDEKTAAIDSLVAKKNQLVAELERLKKSLIFEYVTGKKEVAQ